MAQSHEKTSLKWELLGALYKYGANLESLKIALPHWETKDIQNFLSSYRKRAEKKIQESRKLNVSDDVPIDLWHDMVSNCHAIEGTTNNPKYPKRKKRKLDHVRDQANDYSFLLSRSMMYAAYFENHYRSDNPQEPNYNEIYRYLGQLLAGEEPTQLRPGNASKVIEMITRMKEVIQSPENVSQYLNYLNTHHKVSFLKPGLNPVELAEEKKQQTEKKLETADKRCADHFKICTKPDIEVENVNIKDPSFLRKREDANMKLRMKQQALAGLLTDIPGVNPLEMPAGIMTKPNNILVPPFTKMS